MKERKVQTNIKRHQVRQRRSRSWLLSPVIVTQLALIMVLAGIGAAFALPSNPITTTSTPWAGTGSITETANLDVTNYTLVYNAALTEVTGVTVVITAVAASTADIDLVILDGVGAVQGTGSADGVTCPIGPSSHAITFTGVALADVATVNIVLTE